MYSCRFVIDGRFIAGNMLSESGFGSIYGTPPRRGLARQAAKKRPAKPVHAVDAQGA
jgi:hypothetical protein